MSRNAYNEIGGIIEKWCERNYYDDFVVTIRADGQEFSEYLEFDGNAMCFVWLNDWWEGHQDVELLGFMPLSEIKIYGTPAKEADNGQG